ncbi:MAG: aldo/keto reductase [Candidatus Micrarchaeaceae archaeon]
MITKELGNTGEHIPSIGIGTWKMGVDIKGEIEGIRYAIANGADLIDTAEMYATEELVGEAIAGSEAFIATKVSPHHFHKDDVIKACNSSLSKLGIKQIDLYQLHWPNKSIPISETMSAMEQLVKEGKIRYIGVSNFSIEELEEAQSVLKSNEIVSNQVEYSVLVRSPKKGLLRYMQRNHITLIAYSPLARGAIFSKKYAQVLNKLEEVGAKYGISGAQTALSWLVSQDNVVAIPKATGINHTAQNIKAGQIKLSDEDMHSIDSFLPDGA